MTQRRSTRVWDTSCCHLFHSWWYLDHTRRLISKMMITCACSLLCRLFISAVPPLFVCCSALLSASDFFLDTVWLREVLVGPIGVAAGNREKVSSIFVWDSFSLYIFCNTDWTIKWALLVIEQKHLDVAKKSLWTYSLWNTIAYLLRLRWRWW